MTDHGKTEAALRRQLIKRWAVPKGWDGPSNIKGMVVTLEPCFFEVQNVVFWDEPERVVHLYLSAHTLSGSYTKWNVLEGLPLDKPKKFDMQMAGLYLCTKLNYFFPDLKYRIKMFTV